ncbi:MAG: fructose 1,6-bisphosphatase [Dehalococcoidia bacterium]|nr:fructose 1,6-bisphosphatase [Dehalococcoidia bacterium]
MPQTVTLVHAPIGGRAALLPEVERVVAEAARGTLGEGVTNAYAGVGDGMLTVVLLHDAGEGDPDVHRAAWSALDAGCSAAKSLGVPGLGHGLPVDAIAGTLRGSGISYAELVLTERPSGPIVALLTSGASLGALNVPLARAFTDAFATPGLLGERLRRGFIFEVHDLEEPRKRMFAAPAELYDLLGCLARPERFALKSIVTAEGAVAAVASSARRSDVIADAEDDSPIALVRTGDDAPDLDGLVAAFTATDGAPAVRGIAFHLGRDRLLGPVEVIATAGGQGDGTLARQARREPLELDVSRWSER